MASESGSPPSASPPNLPPLQETQSVQQQQPSAPTEFHGTPPIVHYGALAVAIVAPIGLLLPPRRLSVQNVILSGGGFWGANQVVHDYTGRSLWRRSSERWAAVGRWGQELPPRAEESRRLIEAEKAARRRRREEGEAMAAAATADLRRTSGSTIAASPSVSTPPASTPQRENDGVLHRLWMGGEKEGWKEERMAKEQEALDSGKGYWDLIMEHVREAWNPKEKNGPGRPAEEAGQGNLKKPEEEAAEMRRKRE